MSSIVLYGICMIMMVSGCSESTLNRNAKDVCVLRQAKAAKGCRHVARISADARNFSAGLLFDTRQSCLRKVKNHAARLGGNAVHIVSEEGSSVYVRMQADVYVCDDVPTASGNGFSLSDP